MSSRSNAVRPPRLRQLLKWVGTLACIGLLAATFATRAWGIGWCNPSKQMMLRISAGFLGFSVAPSAGDRFGLRPGWQTFTHAWLYQRGLEFGEGGFRSVYIPLWLLLVAFGLPTLVLWLTPPRNRPRTMLRGGGAWLALAALTLFALAYCVGATSTGGGRVAGVRWTVADGKLTLTRAVYVPPPPVQPTARRTRPAVAVAAIVRSPDQSFLTQSARPKFNLVWPSLEHHAVTGYVIGIPLWIPPTLLLVPVLLFWFQTHRLPPGHCRRCGYDLTGNLSGRCPECGLVLGRRAPPHAGGPARLRTPAAR